MNTGRLIGAILCLVAASDSVTSAEVIAVGSAQIQGNNTSQAREIAVRRAMSRAAESQGLVISSQTTVHQGMVTEISQMRATGCVGQSRVIDESNSNGEVSVRMSISMNGSGECVQTCKRSFINKIIVTDFGFEFGDQVLPQEKAVFKYRTAGEIARAIRKNNRSQVGYDDTEFPYVSAAAAPEPYLLKTDTETPFSKLARTHRGQYVLSGVYRDFEIIRNKFGKPTRRIEIEAFIHDGANGALLGKQTFKSVAVGSVEISDSIPIGSVGFYETDFGSVWGLMLRDIAIWAGEKTACFPFMARVIKNDKDGIVIDAGAESGLSAGDTLNLHLLRDREIRSSTDRHLGAEKEVGGSASLQFVYPRFSVVQLLNNKEVTDKIRVGDLLYSE